MTSYMNPAPQNSTHMKEYGLNKPMPFSSDQTKVKAFLQECLVYIDMNEEIYTTDKLKIGFVLSYIYEQERGKGLEETLPRRPWRSSDRKTGLPHLRHLLSWSAQSIPVYGPSPRCIMQIRKPETGKENGWTNSHRVQAVDWTSRIDNKVNFWQHPFNWAVPKIPELFSRTQDNVWQGHSLNNRWLVWKGNPVWYKLQRSNSYFWPEQEKQQ